MADILSDQPTSDDALGRKQYASALARLVQEAETPFVLGIFGDWGSGKTSLMRMVEARLPASSTRPVWFDAWQHQHDDSPAMALAHTMVDQLELGEEGRKLLTVIAAGFGSMLLKAMTTVTVDDLTKLGERYEAERFQVRDARVRLATHFRSLVQAGRGNNKKRLVIFIDDLDRCAPESALAVLEALKLYLNLEGCLFVIGADRGALERIIATKHGGPAATNTRYLDKVVQLPFSVPPIHSSAMRGFVESLVTAALESATPMLVAGLGGNPRSVKRFVNVLSLNHELAEEARIDEYNIDVLALLLLLQYHDPERFALAAVDTGLVQQMIDARNEEKNASLRAVFELAPPMPPNIGQYIYLAQIAATDEVSEKANSDLMRPVKPDSLLAAIVGEEPLPRTDITKRLWAYIKRNGLQDSRERRMINADEALRPLFSGKDRVSMFEMTKYINKHFTDDRGRKLAKRKTRSSGVKPKEST